MVENVDIKHEHRRWVAPEMKPGIYNNISNEDYHRKIGLSKSGLVNFAKSPEYYQWRLMNPTPSTPAMKLGTHAHTRILEPTRHREIYISAPEGLKKTARKKCAEFESDHPDKIVVTFDEMEMVNAMAESVAKSETASALLSGGKAEQSVFWKDHHGNLCKCRPDYLNEKYKTCVELKTTNDISPYAISRAVSNFKYGWQHYHYMNGMEAVCPGEFEAFVFIFCETKPPYPVVTRILEDGWLIGAELEIEPLLKTYKECMKTDTWPGEPDEIGVIPAPNWYVNRVVFD
jgi:hypothetical protein